MRSINVYFENEDYKRLKKAKGELSWRDFILQLLEEEKENVGELLSECGK